MNLQETSPKHVEESHSGSSSSGPDYDVLLDTRSTEVPLVTIVVSTYNQASYIAETLDSIAAQEFTDFELIVIDDASPDESMDVSLDWARKHEVPVLLIRNRSNQGVVAALATATGLVRTELISFLAGDDVFLPEKLRIQVPLLLGSPPKVGFVYSDAYLMSDAGEHLPETWLQVFKKNATPRHGDLFEAFFTRELHIPVMTLLARTDAIRRSGAFSPGLIYEDLDLMIRLSHVSDGHFSKFPSARYRLRPEGLRAQLSGDVISRCRLDVYRPWLHSPRSTRSFARRQYFQDAWRLYRFGVLTGPQLAKATLDTRSPRHLLLLPVAFSRQAIRKDAKPSKSDGLSYEERQALLRSRVSSPEVRAGESLKAGGELIFVGGSPRSGTTLLQNMLDSHPSVAGGPEFDLVPSIVALRDRMHEKISTGRISAFTSNREVDRSIGTLIEQLLVPYMERHKADYISEKTPANVLVFSELLTIFPEARFLFCVRDPRAIVSSMLEVGLRDRAKRANGGGGFRLPSYTRSVFAGIETIRQYNRAGFHAAVSDRVHVVKYEQLVQAPEAATREIADFLGITWDSSMISPKNHEHGGDSLIDGVWSVAETYRGDPDPARAESWRNNLRPWQKKVIEAAFSGDPDLRNLGYPFGSKRRKFVSSAIGSVQRARGHTEGIRRFAKAVRRRLARRARQETIGKLW
jgi:glycosyltransferase involved in cell wall biosynthesis